MHIRNRVSHPALLLLITVFGISCAAAQGVEASPVKADGVETVSFSNGSLVLGGVLYKPPGPGPFPAILYSHGGAPGLLSNQAFDALGPLFTQREWVFFAPYRRGQGLSASAGSFMGDEIAAAKEKGGMPAGAATMARLLSTDHLSDQQAALHWLRAQSFISLKQIAAFGNSFAGIEALLAAADNQYCAAIDAAGGAQSWQYAPQLQVLMKEAARKAAVPVFFFQAENDYNLAPSRVLSAQMKEAGKLFEIQIYPPFGQTKEDGHAFAYQGNTVWKADVFRFLERHCGRPNSG